MNKYLTKIFIDEINSRTPKKYNEINKKNFSQIVDIWSIDLPDMIDYEASINKRFRQIIAVIDIFSRYTWCKLLKENS